MGAMAFAVALVALTACMSTEECEKMCGAAGVQHCTLNGTCECNAPPCPAVIATSAVPR